MGLIVWELSAEKIEFFSTAMNRNLFNLLIAGKYVEILDIVEKIPKI